MRRTAHIIASALGVAFVAQVAAQNVEGLDIGAIRARAQAQQEDAAALAAEVSKRADALREDASQVEGAALQQVRAIDPKSLPKGPAGAVDFDEIVTAASDNMKDNRGQAPLFMAFVSLSMPEDTLKRVIKDVSQAGGVVVFRGFPNNSAKQFVARLTKVVDKQSQFASIGIDPRLFRAFDVAAVPSYVVTSTDFDLCDGLNCKTVAPPHDSMAGNVTVEYALSTFAEARGPGALVAQTALRNLRGASR